MMVAMRYGLARGIYANEAGYGTAAVAYGTARSREPVQQGLNAVMEVFIVSFVTSTISALTILVSGVWQSGLTSTAVVAQAFNTAIPTVGGWIVAFCAFLFGYTTLIGWAYYGEQFLEYVFGPRVTVPYRWVYCGLIVFGAMGKVELVWAWGDLMNGLQIFPNLVGVIGLSGVAAAALRDSERTPGGMTGALPTAFDAEGRRAVVRRRFARGRRPRARHAAVRLQPRRGRGGVPRLRPRVRSRSRIASATRSRPTAPTPC